MDALIYDIEIVKMISNHDLVRERDIEYCEGWGDHAGMGVSVVGAYDYQEKRYRVFLQDNFTDFMELCAARAPLVSWNGIAFDDKVITANIGPMAESPRYDMFVEMGAAGGVMRSGGSLDAYSWRNTGIRKSGDGALAPMLWQRGQHGTVIDYCLNDIRMTKGMYDLVRSEMPIRCPKSGLVLHPRKPSDVLRPPVTP